MTVEGDANDYTGKGLFGGNMAIFSFKEAIDDGFVAQESVVVGNVCLYGATSGKAFSRGKAGERFEKLPSKVFAIFGLLMDDANKNIRFMLALTNHWIPMIVVLSSFALSKFVPLSDHFNAHWKTNKVMIPPF